MRNLCLHFIFTFHVLNFVSTDVEVGLNLLYILKIPMLKYIVGESCS